MNSSKKSSIKKWIDQFIEKNPPRAKSVVMTLFGDAITHHGGEAWLGSLIELLAPFGINDRLVRTSVFRLAEEGWLNAKREGRRSLYMLNTSAESRLKHAYQRVYAPSNKIWDGKWTLVLATDANISTAQRTILRKELLWEGFAALAPTIFIHPGADTEVLNEIVDRIGIRNSVFICEASNSDLFNGRPLSDLTAQNWQLETIVSDYESFIQCFKPMPKLLSSDVPLSPEQAFVIRTLTIHEFRRVQLHDPQLPSELLPVNWPGKIAYSLCYEIYNATHQLAEEYILDNLRCEDPDAPEVDPNFYERFDGLTK
jgi:phenylacetic acid degradation operon negative regulatory protein